MSNPLAAIDEAAVGWIIAIASLLALGVILFTETWRPRRVLGPARARFDQPVAPLTAAVFAAIVVWLGSQVVYGAYIGGTRTAPPPPPPSATQSVTTSQPTTAESNPPARASRLKPHDLAILSTVPPVLGSMVMIVFVASMPGWIAVIGLDLARIARGAMFAIVGIVVAYPIVFWAMQIIERIYAALHYEHPSEHEILQQLGDNPSAAVKIGLIFGATVAAPLFEELFFRGGLQTLLRWFFTRQNAGRESPAVAWVPILAVSLLFAMIHTFWMAPAIFVLSLCLGYLYERTGNLWACIFMHAMFNIINTSFYLSN